MRAQAMVHKALAQKVLLYGSDSWVVTEAMLKVLEGLHHRVDRRIAGMQYRKVGEELWGWSSVTSGLWTMKEYIWRRLDTIAEYITNHPIYELCKGAERMRGSNILMR